MSRAKKQTIAETVAAAGPLTLPNRIESMLVSEKNSTLTAMLPNKRLVSSFLGSSRSLAEIWSNLLRDFLNDINWLLEMLKNAVSEPDIKPDANSKIAIRIICQIFSINAATIYVL